MKNPGMGWLRDYCDFRDYTPEAEAIASMLGKSRATGKSRKTAQASADLSKWCSTIENQEDIGSCTAHAGVGLVEYFENRAHGKYIDASRLFLYKVTRNLMKLTGDTGAYLRTTMQAMVLFGVPPEKYMPYETDHFDEEPSAFCYSFAQNYQAINYYRLDPPGISTTDLLKTIKNFISAGFPSMFGFTVFSSMRTTGPGNGDIPFPREGEKVQGGHAVVAIGYDDSKKIGEQKGALKIRNSWGENWGEVGYGWLPYAYVEQGMANDFWTVLTQEWVDSGNFE